MIGAGALAAVLVLVACGDGGRDADAAAPRDASVVAEDAIPRPPRDPDSGAEHPPYAACAGDDDCAEGDSCDLGFPRGMCTHGCRSAADCPGRGVCLTGSCFPACDVGGAQCRDDQLCAIIAVGTCLPSCSERADTAQSCASGLECSGNACLPPRSHGAAPLGAPCTSGGECATGACATEETGWPEGMCVRPMRIPAAEAWLGEPGSRYPAGGCLDDQALWPDTRVEGDVGDCVPRCTSDADCREGYVCDRRGHFEAPVHADGACRPWNCGPTREPGCPAGFECAPLAGGTFSVCRDAAP